MNRIALGVLLTSWVAIGSTGESMQPSSNVTVDTFPGELDGGTGGISIDRDGNVYVADFGAVLGDAATMGRQIFKLTPPDTAAVFATGFEGASGNEFDAQGFLYQSNIRGNYVSRIAPDGTHTLFVREGIAAPVGIVIDEHGTLFVANCGDGSIRRVTSDGASHAFLQDELLQCPNGITLDDDANLYVANFNNGDVIKITPDAKPSRLATLPGNNNGHLTYHDGNLYVVARSDHRIYRVSLAGDATPFAGDGTRGRRDGPAATARFSYPNDIAFDPRTRTFYVNDIAATTGEHTQLSPMVVRRIQLAP